VVIGAKQTAGLDACRDAFDVYVTRGPESDPAADLSCYLGKRRIVEQGDLSEIRCMTSAASGELRQRSRRCLTSACMRVGWRRVPLIGTQNLAKRRLRPLAA
jgi:hypothetical protein